MMEGQGIPLLDRARDFAERVALEDGDLHLDYAGLLRESQRIAAGLLDGHSDLEQARVAFLVPPGLDYVRVQWGIWQAGGVAVPLCTSHPAPELDYVLADAQVKIVIADPLYMETLSPLAAARGVRLFSTATIAQEPTPLPRLDPERLAMIVYTSGTTGGPKGAATTHGNIQAQVEALVSAWGWTRDDRILLTLPLHHVHGIVNVLCCSLWSGATCRIHASFDAGRVWRAFSRAGLTLFMGVPTMYFRLIKAWQEASKAEQQEWSRACRGFRLMVSGSAALPESVLEQWLEISGHTLLERYGMTETGMILSNPLDGDRVPGAVGAPLPGVEVRLVGDNGEEVSGSGEGEVQVRGPAVFREYWNRPEATTSAFSGSWFRTGDISRFDGKIYKLLGRASVDIVKTGGYKVSALEIEEVLRRHPRVEDCAVVGIADEEWGERVVAAVVPTNAERAPSAEDLRAFTRERLAAYKSPREFRQVSSLPRNTLGKVTKNDVKALFTGSNPAGDDGPRGEA